MDQNRKYTIEPYNPKWNEIFQTEAKIVKQVFAGEALTIEHVGSTSVPGLAGKPTIDVLVLVEHIDSVDKRDPFMEAAGYEARGEYVVPNARLFVKEKDSERLVNIHVFEKDHPHAHEMRAFRDYLKKHPEDVKAYSDVKFDLFKKHPENYAEYRKGKNGYVADLQKKIKSGGTAHA